MEDTADTTTGSDGISSRNMIELKIGGKVSGERGDIRVEKPCFSDAKN